jgi:hypothetical protein
MSVIRRVAILLCAALLAVQVVRNAAVEALAQAMPQTAARLWSDHPEVLAQSGMIAIGAATGKGQPVPPQALEDVYASALKAPLLAQPLLVRGVQALQEGKQGLARAAFIAAERRDPRALPAHYFLADLDLASGNVTHGLSELAALAALAPEGATSVAPFVATAARDRRNWPAVRELFRRNPNVVGPTLSRLAVDPGNAATILALAGGAAPAAKEAWLGPLLGSMTAAGKYSEARDLWASQSNVRVSSDSPLFDSAFSKAGPPPPFNWALTSSPVGLAERAPGGRLHAIFYGQQDGPLARQLLVLKPGTYRLTMRISGDPERREALNWSATCDKSSTPLATIDLATASRQPWSFTVPSSCPAVWLELAGEAEEIAKAADVTISELRMTRVGANG